MTSDRRPARLHDVATLADVSHVTVSRALNERPNVRPATRDRVLAAAAELEYQPNVAARTLVTSRSHGIGVVAAHATLFGPASTVFAIEQAARHRGYTANIVSLPDLAADTVESSLAHLAQLRVDGIVVIAPQATASEVFLSRRPGVPVVAVDGGLDAELPIVRVDQAMGARLMTEHLLSLGHRTVHHLAGPLEWHEADQRTSGWRQTLQAAGRDVPEVHRGDWSAASGYAQGRLPARDPDVTAVFAANDHLAVGCLRALQEAGRAVPEDVSVGGFDDVPESPYFGPALTTVRQHFEEVGRLAVLTLLDVVEGRAVSPGRAPERTVAPDLIRRASTAAPSR